jgi:23S rRNA (cytidine1920-2'-O)/16S rRNA (cytidine1409-2'-O)-methyltransferase
VRRLLTDDGQAIALVKPQFEAGRDAVPRGGVVRDPAVWERVLADLSEHAEEAGLHAVRAIRSPITGTDGNVEFLVDLRMRKADGDYASSVVSAVHGAESAPL